MFRWTDRARRRPAQRRKGRRPDSARAEAEATSFLTDPKTYVHNLFQGWWTENVPWLMLTEAVRPDARDRVLCGSRAVKGRA